MMKPYGRRNLDQQQKIFNYRLSRARRVVKNASGILALRFQCFLGQMRQEPDTVRLLVEAAVMLHNLLTKRYQALDVRMLDQEDAQHNLIPGAWRTAAITEEKVLRCSPVFVGGKWRRMAETKWYLARSSHQSGAVWLAPLLIWSALARTIRLCWNYLARSGAKWRHVAQNLIGATWRAPLHSSGFQ